MTILVLEDSLGLRQQSVAEGLITILEERGLEPILFNGYSREGEKIRDRGVTVKHIAGLFQRTSIDGIVLDLHWHDDDWHMIEVFRKLRQDGILPNDLTQDVKVVVWSKFLEQKDPDFRDILHREFGIPHEQMFDRLSTEVSVIADQFSNG